jgi:hypothetical protein
VKQAVGLRPWLVLQLPARVPLAHSEEVANDRPALDKRIVFVRHSTFVRLRVPGGQATFLTHHGQRELGEHQVENISEPKPRRYLDAHAIRERYGNRSDQWIRNRLQFDPLFPKPIVKGKLRLWREDQLDAWDDLAR